MKEAWMEERVEGLRVVRGPHWSSGQDDGGEGHVGTVTADNHNGTVTVQWDMGNTGTYSTGADKKYDLRVLDSAPAGIRHQDKTCSSCEVKCIHGTMWRCTVCPDVNICNGCYSGDKHDNRHPFERLDSPGMEGFPVKKRSISTKIRSMGIYAGSTVNRTETLCEDGDATGTVSKVVNYDSSGGKRDAVIVIWQDNSTSTCRIGFQGKVDLVCVEGMPGLEYYREHLKVLGTSESYTSSGEGIQAEELQKTEHDEPRPMSVLSKTEHLNQDLTNGQKSLWSTSQSTEHMYYTTESNEEHRKPQPATTSSETPRNNKESNKDSQSESSETLQDNRESNNGQHKPKITSKSPETTQSNSESKRGHEKPNTETGDPRLRIGDKVCVYVPESTLKELQWGHGGWTDEMSRYIGRYGQLVHIERNDDLIIDYGDRTFRFNRGAIRKVPKLQFGDQVKIIEDAHKAQVLQPSHGRWCSEYAETLGKVGKVVNIDSDGNVAVELGDTAFVYNAACCELVNEPSVDRKESNGNTNSTKNAHESRRARNDSDSASCRVFGGDINETTTGNPSAEVFAESLRGMQQLLQSLGGMASLESLAQNLEQPVLNPAMESMASMLLVQASAANDITMVHLVLQNNREVINAKHQGLTALIVASNEGNKAVVEMLIAAGADVNLTDTNGNTALMAAALKNREDIANNLIRAGANMHKINTKGQCILHFAAVGQANDVLKEALQQGVDPNIQENNNRDTPLHTAIMSDNIAGAFCLIDNTNVNIEISNNIGHTALSLAAMRGSVALVEALVDRLPSLVNAQKPEDGYTALHVAAINDAVGVIVALLKRNANVNIPCTEHAIPLHLSCNEGYIESARLLINAGANVNAQDNAGNTPLHHCVGQWRKKDLLMINMLLGGMDKRVKEVSERTELGCLLIKHGASVNVLNTAGRLPLQICIDAYMRDVLQTCSEMKARRELEAGQNIYNILRRRETNLFLQVFSRSSILCLNCLENTVDTKIAPCGHLAVCRTCAINLHKCLVCNVKIEERFDMDGNRLMDADCQHRDEQQLLQ